MSRHLPLADGLYRLVKREEDHNPVFPNEETVVEIQNGETVTNVSTGRKALLSALRSTRELYGPLTNPYDLRPISDLPRVTGMHVPRDLEPKKNAEGF